MTQRVSLYQEKLIVGLNLFGSVLISTNNVPFSETQELAKNLAEVNKELALAHKRRQEERRRAEAAENLLNPEQRRNVKNDKLKKEEQELTNKIRGTIKAYKEFKTFLQHLMPKIAPADNEGTLVIKLPNIFELKQPCFQIRNMYYREL